jgi:type IV secretory pathway VirB9-like protein
MFSAGIRAHVHTSKRHREQIEKGILGDPTSNKATPRQIILVFECFLVKIGPGSKTADFR